MSDNIRAFAVKNDNIGETIESIEYTSVIEAQTKVENENRDNFEYGFAPDWRVIILDGETYTYTVEMTYYPVDLKLGA